MSTFDEEEGHPFVETPEPVWEEKLFRGHEGYVMTVAFSSDGALMGTGSYDGTAKLWSVKKNKVKQTFEGHSGPVLCVAFSPSTTTPLFATVSKDKTARIWDTTTFKLLTTLKGHTCAIFTCAFAKPDGRTFATGSRDQTARVWDLRNRKEMQSLGHLGPVNSLAFSGTANEAKLLATASGDKTCKIWDLKTFKLVKCFTGHKGNVLSVACSPDGKFVATGSKDETVRIWSIEKQVLLFELRDATSFVNFVSFSPTTSRLLAAASLDHKVRLYDLNQQACIEEYDYEEHALCCAFSRDGTAVAVGAQDNIARLHKLEQDVLDGTRIRERSPDRPTNAIYANNAPTPTRSEASVSVSSSVVGSSEHKLTNKISNALMSVVSSEASTPVRVDPVVDAAVAFDDIKTILGLPRDTVEVKLDDDFVDAFQLHFKTYFHELANGDNAKLQDAFLRVIDPRKKGKVKLLQFSVLINSWQDKGVSLNNYLKTLVH